MKIDKKIIKELNEYLEEFNLTEIEITEKDTKIKVSKNIGSNINQPSMAPYSLPTEKNISENNQIIKELSDYLDEFNLTELEYTEKDTRIKVSKNNFSINNQTIPISNDSSSNLEAQNIKISKAGIEITSPIIGTAYHSPEPGGKKFVEVGKKIKKGDTVMIIEAMKTMNHVPSTADGIVKEICVDDGQAVEFGQTIIILE